MFVFCIDFHNCHRILLLCISLQAAYRGRGQINMREHNWITHPETKLKQKLHIYTITSERLSVSKWSR